MEPPARRIIACLDVRCLGIERATLCGISLRSNESGDLVVTKGDQYDVREKGQVRILGLQEVGLKVF